MPVYHPSLPWCGTSRSRRRLGCFNTAAEAAVAHATRLESLRVATVHRYGGEGRGSWPHRSLLWEAPMATPPMGASLGSHSGLNGWAAAALGGCSPWRLQPWAVAALGGCSPPLRTLAIPPSRSLGRRGVITITGWRRVATQEDRPSRDQPQPARQQEARHIGAQPAQPIDGPPS